MSEHPTHPKVEQPSNDTSSHKPGDTGGAALNDSSPVNENNALKQQLLRALADNENLRKRHAKELSEARKFSVSKAVSDFLIVFDNLTRTQNYLENKDIDNPDVKSLYRGVELTLKELMKAFENNGVEQIIPQRGDAFDHDLHQAMSQVDADNLDDNAVAELFQSGFLLNGRLLRPALVSVAKKTK